MLAEAVRSRPTYRGRVEVCEEDLQKTFLMMLDCLPNKRGRRLLLALKNANVEGVNGSHEEEEIKALGLVTEGVHLRLTEKAERLFSQVKVF